MRAPTAWTVMIALWISIILLLAAMRIARSNYQRVGILAISLVLYVPASLLTSFHIITDVLGLTRWDDQSADIPFLTAGVSGLLAVWALLNPHRPSKAVAAVVAVVIFLYALGYLWLLYATGSWLTGSS